MVVMILIIVLLSKFALHFFHNKSKEWIWNCKFLSRKLMYIAWCNICWYLSYHTNPSVIQWARSNCFYAQQFLIFINAFNSFSIWITPKIRENGCHLIHGFHDHSIYHLRDAFQKKKSIWRDIVPTRGGGGKNKLQNVPT